MNTAPEPLGGLIEFMAFDADGNGITRFRYYSMLPHSYGNGHFAGRFVDGVYTCAMPDGSKVIEADGADGVGVTIFGEDGLPVATFRTSQQAMGRCEIEASSGKFFGWHANGKLALVATFSQAMYDAWGIDAKVSPQAAQSAHSRAGFRTCVEPWLAAAARIPDDLVRAHAARGLEALRMHAQQGLAALRASDQIDMTTILALMVLRPPTIDHDASVLCHLLMSCDPEVRATAHALLDKLGADAARAAVRLAGMKQEDHHDAVQAWVDAALLALGRHGLAELKRESTVGDEERGMLASTIEWLEANLGG
jgi:hypothetical protein